VARRPIPRPADGEVVIEGIVEGGGGGAIGLHNLGHVAAQACRPAEAVEHFGEALVIYRTMEADPGWVRNTERHRAESIAALGQASEAPP
jgi:hypothetical protein